jgi:poly-gamma-glutamate capsule biosynthesis protein CapA/YwtB (metallophosphatase superfamily)
VRCRCTAVLLVTTVAVLWAAAGDGPASPRPTTPAIRLLLVGDVMLGRAVAPVVVQDPSSVFADVAGAVAAVDLALVTLESPLTGRELTRPVAHDLRASPVAATVLAGAGFDVVTVATNHAMDSGPAGLADTVEALHGAGLLVVGAGADLTAALEPVVVEVGEVTVAVLAVDATPSGPAAPPPDGPVAAVWDARGLEGAVVAARALAEVVVVSIHGGAEYLDLPDRDLRQRADALVGWGADVVWGHGAHLRHPVVADVDAVVATGLGNLLFDRQLVPGTDTGTVLEIVIGADGPRAIRTGTVTHAHGRVGRIAWEPPPGPAVALAGGWYELLDPTVVADGTSAAPTRSALAPPALAGRRIDAIGRGDVDGDGDAEVVVAFRRPARPTALASLRPEGVWRDREDATSHVGVYGPDGAEIWVAGSVAHPVTALTVCDGALAVTQLDAATGGPQAGAWWWNGFGFDELATLPGAGEPRCVDVDGDGRTEPLVSRP